MNHPREGDRVRHVDGTEGIVKSIDISKMLPTITVHMDEGGEITTALGYWERIPGGLK